jgi:hypothetical protein
MQHKYTQTVYLVSLYCVYHLFIGMLNVVMLDVTMVDVIKVNVVAPCSDNNSSAILHNEALITIVTLSWLLQKSLLVFLMVTIKMSRRVIT